MKNEPIRGSGSKEMDCHLVVKIKRNVNVSHWNVGRVLPLKLQLWYAIEFLPLGNVNTAQLEEISNTLSSGKLKNLAIYFKVMWQFNCKTDV
jgi:hypothetical protein